jgi:hypothetical protein
MNDELQAFGEYLNSKGYGIDLDKDMLWADYWAFQDHPTEEVFTLCKEFFNHRHEEAMKQRAIEFADSFIEYECYATFEGLVGFDTTTDEYYNEKYGK